MCPELYSTTCESSDARLFKSGGMTRFGCTRVQNASALFGRRTNYLKRSGSFLKFNTIPFPHQSEGIVWVVVNGRRKSAKYFRHFQPVSHATNLDWGWAASDWVQMLRVDVCQSLPCQCNAEPQLLHQLMMHSVCSIVCRSLHSSPRYASADTAIEGITSKNMGLASFDVCGKKEPPDNSAPDRLHYLLIGRFGLESSRFSQISPEAAKNQGAAVGIGYCDTMDQMSLNKWWFYGTKSQFCNNLWKNNNT